MKTASIVALSSFLSLVAAAPLNKDKRHIVWVTDWAEVVETVAITTTVWIDAPNNVRAQATGGWRGQGWGYNRPQSQAAATTAVDSTSAAPAAPVATSEVEVSEVVAPAPPTTQAATTEAPATTQAPATTEAPSTTQAPATTETPAAPATIEAPAPAATQAPATTQATAVPETPTSVYVPPPPTTTSAAPVVSTAPTSPSPSGTVYTGDITYYDVGMGSCGWVNTANEAVVAIPHGMMGNGINPNNNPLCGKSITISYQGAQHQAKIVDTCGGCDGAAIDLSTSLFTAVAPNGDGRVPGINWWFN